MTRAFASQADMAEKKITFSRLSEHAYAFTAEGDPNTGIVVGDDAVMVIDAQATPRMAQTVIEKIRTVTDKPRYRKSVNANPGRSYSLINPSSTMLVEVPMTVTIPPRIAA